MKIIEIDRQSSLGELFTLMLHFKDAYFKIAPLNVERFDFKWVDDAWMLVSERPLAFKFIFQNHSFYPKLKAISLSNVDMHSDSVVAFIQMLKDTKVESVAIYGNKYSMHLSILLDSLEEIVSANKDLKTIDIGSSLGLEELTKLFEPFKNHNIDLLRISGTNFSTEEIDYVASVLSQKHGIKNLDFKYSNIIASMAPIIRALRENPKLKSLTLPSIPEEEEDLLVNVLEQSDGIPLDIKIGRYLPAAKKAQIDYLVHRNQQTAIVNHVVEFIRNYHEAINDVSNLSANHKAFLQVSLVWEKLAPDTEQKILQRLSQEYVDVDGEGVNLGQSCKELFLDWSHLFMLSKSSNSHLGELAKRKSLLLKNETIPILTAKDSLNLVISRMPDFFAEAEKLKDYAELIDKDCQRYHEEHLDTALMGDDQIQS